jgi:hypothetical protein
VIEDVSELEVWVSELVGEVSDFVLLDDFVGSIELLDPVSLG